MFNSKVGKNSLSFFTRIRCNTFIDIQRNLCNKFCDPWIVYCGWLRKTYGWRVPAYNFYFKKDLLDSRLTNIITPYLRLRRHFGRWGVRKMTKKAVASGTCCLCTNTDAIFILFSTLSFMVRPPPRWSGSPSGQNIAITIIKYQHLVIFVFVVALDRLTLSESHCPSSNRQWRAYCIGEVYSQNEILSSSQCHRKL